MKLFGYRTLKSSIGAVISITIATLVGLDSAASAGINTILSVQNTKRKSFILAYKRILSAMIALLVCSLLFILFGFTTIVFGLFLFVYITLVSKINLSEGIIVGAVLALHVLSAKQITTVLITNEILLVLIGVIVALIVNLYFPSLKTQLLKEQNHIESKMKEIINDMAYALENQIVSINEDKLFKSLKDLLLEAHRSAYLHMNNYFFSTENYFLQYMEMRLRQYEVLQHMRKHFKHLYMTVEQTKIISKFTYKVSEELNFDNDGSSLITELDEMTNKFSEMNLPESRIEFRHRAMLFQFLNDLKEFIYIKYEFINK